MALEYFLILVMSAAILAGSFGMSTGPVKMFSESSPKLAHRLERKLMTGSQFFVRTKGIDGHSVGWKR
ncbi:MAG: hypothetical protein ACR2M7_04075 [Bdellovibrionales bacterium]